jgi:hypothetical protein
VDVRLDGYLRSPLTTTGNAVLHVIAAILSLLLLAGMFGNGLDATDDESAAPACECGTNEEMAQARDST